MTGYILWDGAREAGAVDVARPSQLPPAPAGSRWIAIAGDIAASTLVAGKSEPVEQPRTVPIEVARAARWADAKTYRTLKLAAGCATPLGRVQTDDVSMMRIVTAAGDATNNQAKLPLWSIDWVMADNSVKTHGAAQMIAMAAAVRGYVAACQKASQAIRTTIDAAATTAAVAAVDITAGYPA